MNDALTWCMALLLVGAGVAAEVYLAWVFIHDWNVARAANRSRRAQSKTRRPNDKAAAANQHRRPFAALASVGLATGVAGAHAPAAQPDASTPPTTSASTAPTLQTPQPTPPASTAPSEAPASPNAPTAPTSTGSALSVQLNVDFTNAYFYRGIRQQDKGLIVQPAARLTARLVDDTDVKLDGFLGTWNSFGPNAGTQTGGLIEDWYESDIYAGFTLSRGNLSLTTSYTFLTSPSDAYQTVQELGFTLALDDSEWLEAWAMKPYAMLAIETGSNGSDGADLDNGAYLELGIAPGLSFDLAKTPVTFTFPASVGLSLSDYYQDAAGSDDAFGFAQVGAKASIPLGEPGRFGTWTLNTGVSVLFLGDHTRAFNNADDTEIIGSIGLQWSF